MVTPILVLDPSNLRKFGLETKTAPLWLKKDGQQLFLAALNLFCIENSCPPRESLSSGTRMFLG
jgi:hypothetical protein